MRNRSELALSYLFCAFALPRPLIGTLDVATQTITQDISSYTLPDDLEDLIRILVGILEKA
jgi:hypothetical protein